ncbi:uncharacterized protein LOC142627900 [Castanea sativa]|uniref:uncharacterized protein LOC142627900 n=1 Tax=Castanea sativa TaxID=21020 RepID=UPI003F6545C5
MGKALLQISCSPFFQRIKQAYLPRHFNHPTFTIYNGRIDPIEHVSHFNQRMAIHSKNKALMCKVFPSSLGLVVMRWFDSLAKGSIHSFEELTRAFGARFLTCNLVPRPLNSLLSMSIREGETLKTYSVLYWEIYNEIDRDFEDFAVRTFKVGLPTNSNLCKSLITKPPWNMHQLMDRIEEHKRVEDNQSSARGKTKVSTTDRKDNSADRLGSGLHSGGAPRASSGKINVIFVTLREEPHPARGVMLVSSQVEGPEGKASRKSLEFWISQS